MAEQLNPKDVTLLLEEATQSLSGSLEPATDLKALEGWDSMGMVMFMGLVHERAGFELSVHDLRECETVSALTQMISERQRV